MSLKKLVPFEDQGKKLTIDYLKAVDRSKYLGELLDRLNININVRGLKAHNTAVSIILLGHDKDEICSIITEDITKHNSLPYPYRSEEEDNIEDNELLSNVIDRFVYRALNESNGNIYKFVYPHISMSKEYNNEHFLSIDINKMDIIELFK